MYSKKTQNLNVDFWNFVYLVTSYPELYLTESGKIINKIVTSNGRCHNLSKLSKNMNMNKSMLNELCKKIEESGHIIIFKEGNCKSIKFTEKVKNEGLKIIETMTGK